MTILELAQRDLRKANSALVQAMKRPNVPEQELDHIIHLVNLRNEIVELLENDRVVVFPVKPGDTVYTISRGKIKEWTVYYVGMNAHGIFMFNFHDVELHHTRSACDEDIGETVFLTQEDAITELKERNGKK